MCGIGGFAGSGPQDEGFEPALLRMARALAHRGPDGEGVWVDAARRVGLAHRRLAIVDLSSAGAQPMTAPDGRLTLVFNGEIYNWRELRAELEAKGDRFVSRSDSEVLLAAYRRYGAECLSKLRGMFAFAIYDAAEDVLFLARDRVGKKPLVYTETGTGFRFASEIPALFAFGPLDAAIDASALGAFMLHNLRQIPEPATAYRAIRRLRPGHAMIVRGGRVDRMWRYWLPQPRPGGPVGAAEIRRDLEEAVRLRMLADVPVAALLSGGVDSSAVVGLMARHAREPVATFAFGRDENDEDIARARRIAALYRTDHHERFFDGESQLDDYKRLLAIHGEPVALLPLLHGYRLSRGIREAGARVALTGIGADEVFFGYLGFARQAWLGDAERWAGPLVRAVAAAAGGALAPLAAPPGRRRAAHYRAAAAGVWRRWFAPDARPAMENVAAAEIEALAAAASPQTFIDETAVCGLMIENAASVALATDLPGMAASIELRAPFLDQELLATALAAPYRAKVPRFAEPGGLKRVLKDAVADLVPHDLLFASKRGFGMDVQESRVFAGPWSAEADALLRTPDDAGGLLDARAIAEAWSGFRDGGRTPAIDVSRLFSLQLWLQQLRPGHART